MYLLCAFSSASENLVLLGNTYLGKIKLILDNYWSRLRSKIIFSPKIIKISYSYYI